MDSLYTMPMLKNELPQLEIKIGGKFEELEVKVKNKTNEKELPKKTDVARKRIEFHEDKRYLKLQAANNIKDALPLAETLMKKYPNSEPFVYRNLGAIYYFYEKDTEKAKECFEAAYSKHSGDGYVLTMLGRISEDFGRFHDAERYFKAAAGIKYALEEKNNLAYFYIINNRLEDAEMVLDDTVGTSLHVSSPEGAMFCSIKFTKAVIKFLSGDAKSAKLLFEDAFKQHSKKAPSKETILVAARKYLDKKSILPGQADELDKVLRFINSLDWQ